MGVHLLHHCWATAALHCPAEIEVKEKVSLVNHLSPALFIILNGCFALVLTYKCNEQIEVHPILENGLTHTV